PCTTRLPGGVLGEIPPRGVRESRPRMITRRIPLLASEDEEAVVTDARAGAGGFAYGRGRGSRVVGEASQGRGGARGAGGGGVHRARRCRCSRRRRCGPSSRTASGVSCC